MDRPELSARAPAGAMGRVALGFLGVALLSGIALAPFWSASRPLDSLERLEGGVPWGSFLRGVHAWAAYGLLVTLVWHLVEVVLRRTEAQLPPAVWWRSVALLPAAVLALVGGFAMRGGAESVAALAVWRRIAGSVPLAGPRLAALLLGGDGRDLGAVALHHAGTFTLVLWLLTAEHGLKLFGDFRSWVLAGLAAFALAGVLPVGLGAPPTAATPHLLLGPWYLLGLQGALVDLPPWTGWALPLAFVLLLGLLRHARGRGRAALLGALLAMLAADLAFTARLLALR